MREWKAPSTPYEIKQLQSALSTYFHCIEKQVWETIFDILSGIGSDFSQDAICDLLQIIQLYLAQ